MRRMVGIDGEILENIACPVSDEFLDYMRQKFTILANSKPDFIWVDDDCRFTHLGGQYPCFCEECVKNFENGIFKSREELVEKLNDPENRDLRIKWSAYGADRLARFCEVVRDAVDKVDPNIDIGFMTVGATHTTFSGDYIKKCMTALRSRRGRPGHDLYTDSSLDKLMWKSLEAGRQVLEYPSTTMDILWEEDSNPQGHLSKSFKTRENEISLALMAGCNGINFNHLTMNGNLYERLGREVDEFHNLRPRWEKFLEFANGLKRLCGMHKTKVHYLETAEDHLNIIAELPPRLFRHKFISLLKAGSYKLIITKICPESPCLQEKDFWIKENVERSYIPEHPERNITAIADFLNANRITPQSADEADATGDTEVNQQPE
jgi:REP element-mobilizing transposase RayT